MTNHNDCLLFIWSGLPELGEEFPGVVPGSPYAQNGCELENIEKIAPKKLGFFGGLGLLCLFQICQCFMLRKGDKKYENIYCGNFQSTFIRNRLIGSANARSRSAHNEVPSKIFAPKKSEIFRTKNELQKGIQSAH